MKEYKPVIFKLDKEMYGIDISLVQGIENEQEVVKVPNTAPYIKGIMNLRGKVIPVYSLRAKFNMPESDNEVNQYIIVNVGEVMIALEVDKVEEIYNVDSLRIHEAPVIVKNGNTSYIDKVIDMDGKIIVTIDVNNLLTEEESAGVKSMVNSL